MTQVTESVCELTGLAQVAYVPQAAFIYNATVRENILFGLPYEEAALPARASRRASLGPDLLLLTGVEEQPKTRVVVPMCWGSLTARGAEGWFKGSFEDNSME